MYFSNKKYNNYYAKIDYIFKIELGIATISFYSIMWVINFHIAQFSRTHSTLSTRVQLIIYLFEEKNITKPYLTLARIIEHIILQVLFG